MDFTELMGGEFNPWEVPLSPAAIEQLTRIEEHLKDYRDRLNKQINCMHEARLKTRKEAGLPGPDRYEPRNDPRAGCRFQSIKGDQILYSGQIWFRGECDSFGADECEPLPLELLDASQDTITAHFAAQASRQRLALDEQRQAAEKAATEAREAADRADFERLRLKFGGR